MNQDLVVFAIGGAGARFLRSLVFQLASGLKLNKVDKIKIIIIDADSGNGNLQQPLTLIKLYSEIRTELYSDTNYKGGLFYHPIEFFDPEAKILSPIDEKNRSISQIISYDGLDEKQRNLIDLLLTEDELMSNLQVGFEGRPNMGTIGLQRLNVSTSRSRSLDQLIGDNPNPSGLLSAEARIFIVSSMFGGMGSSGMPLLLRKFASPSFKNCKIACLSFMPYYRIDSGEGTTDSKHFIPRTQIALEYYNEELKDKTDAIYYIGDDLAKSKGEIHAKGGNKQKNKAHYVEFYSVSSLIHFCANSEKSKRNAEQRYLCIDGGKKANSSAYSDIYKKYQLLVFIAKYCLEHFLTNYEKPALENLSWIVHSNLAEFEDEHKELLKDFFLNLIQYNDEELNKHSGMKVVNSEMFPENISSAIPYPEYRPEKNFLGREVKYDNWPVFNAKVIDDSNVRATKHIPRLLSIFENSFSSFYKERFNG